MLVQTCLVCVDEQVSRWYWCRHVLCVLMNRYHAGAGASMSCGDDDDCIPSAGQRNNTKNKKTLESEHCLMFVDMNYLAVQLF